MSKGRLPSVATWFKKLSTVFSEAITHGQSWWLCSMSAAMSDELCRHQSSGALGTSQDPWNSSIWVWGFSLTTKRQIPCLTRLYLQHLPPRGCNMLSATRQCGQASPGSAQRVPRDGGVQRLTAMELWLILTVHDLHAYLRQMQPGASTSDHCHFGHESASPSGAHSSGHQNQIAEVLPKSALRIADRPRA